MGDTCFCPCDVRCTEGMTPNQAFVTELENLNCDAKEKRTKPQAKAEIPMRSSGTDLLVVALKSL